MDNLWTSEVTVRRKWDVVMRRYFGMSEATGLVLTLHEAAADRCSDSYGGCRHVSRVKCRVALIRLVVG